MSDLAEKMPPAAKSIGQVGDGLFQSSRRNR